jgi:farnesyl-diphosphate farnesyltransferase
MAPTPQPASAEKLDDLLLKTSRTFALSIPVLPQPTRTEVTVAYLLFRIADTLEDATDWEPSRKLDELDAFGALLRGEPAVDASGLAERWLERPPLENRGYLELLSELPAVLDAFARLTETARELVRAHTLRTVERMSEFVRRFGDDRGLELTDVDELRDYCYAVAGIVGEMLTELFLVGCPGLDSIAPSLRVSAAKFGEALQLVNILKDSASDANEGRRYLPAAVDRREVFALARGDLEDARRYVLDLQQHGAPHGMVAFTALPVLLARSTLDRVERDGAGAKLTRSEVAGIAYRLDQALSCDDPAVP